MGRPPLSGPKYRAIRRALKYTRRTFVEIGQRFNTTNTTVQRINLREGIRSKDEIKQSVMQSNIRRNVGPNEMQRALVDKLILESDPSNIRLQDIANRAEVNLGYVWKRRNALRSDAWLKHEREKLNQVPAAEKDKIAADKEFSGFADQLAGKYSRFYKTIDEAKKSIRTVLLNELDYFDRAKSSEPLRYLRAVGRYKVIDYLRASHKLERADKKTKAPRQKAEVKVKARELRVKGLVGLSKYWGHAGLRPLESRVLRLCLDGIKQREQAGIIGLTEGRISQIHSNMLAKLKAASEGKPIPGVIKKPAPAKEVSRTKPRAQVTANNGKTKPQVRTTEKKIVVRAGKERTRPQIRAISEYADLGRYADAVKLCYEIGAHSLIPYYLENAEREGKKEQAARIYEMIRKRGLNETPTTAALLKRLAKEGKT